MIKYFEAMGYKCTSNSLDNAIQSFNIPIVVHILNTYKETISLSDNNILTLFFNSSYIYFDVLSKCKCIGYMSQSLIFKSKYWYFSFLILSTYSPFS